MEERIIIEGKPSKKTATLLLKIGLILVAFGLLLFVMTAESSWQIQQTRDSYFDTTVTAYDYIYALGDCIVFADLIGVSIVLDLGILFSIYSFILWLSIKSNCITVTSKRVYGVTAWSKRVDLPLNQISAVSTSWLKGIAVGTSSGKIVFKAIENYVEVHKEITSLLAAKQDVSAPPAPVATQEAPVSSAEELKKYKELLDMGAISQEEFDAKKKQLLGL